MGLIMQNGISYGGVDIVKLTQAEYDALPSSKNSDGILYAITDGESSSSGGASKPVELTKAQYEALGDSVLNDNILYAITDGDELSAKNLEYDGSVTGLGNNVQEAIDELNSNLSNVSGIPDYTQKTQITSLPFTVPSNGVLHLNIGTTTSSGTRKFYINEILIGTFSTHVTYLPYNLKIISVRKGDVLTSDLAIFGEYSFYPYA